MSQAKAYLEKFGWREGQGLGKERNGRVSCVRVQKRAKECASGVGLKPFESDCMLWDAEYWSNLYNSASKSNQRKEKSESLSSSRIYDGMFVKSSEKTLDDGKPSLPVLPDVTRVLFKDRSKGKLRRIRKQDLEHETLPNKKKRREKGPKTVAAP